MFRETFTIAYDGSALREGTMDVRDLAPALLALGQLVDAANANLNGDRSHVKLQVRATEVGSFQITLELVQSWTTHVLHFFASEDANGATNLLTWVLGLGAPGTFSLIKLTKWLKGRSPDRAEKVSDDTMRITIDGETLDVPLALMRLYQDLAVRGAAQRLIEEPLKKDGIDAFEVREAGQTTVRVDSSEASFFAKPALDDEVLVDETRRSAFSIVSLAFKEDNKWRLYDGNTQISAAISDQDFLQRVDANQIAFAKGDILICDVRVIQKRTGDGLRTEYVVERVVEHRPAARQLPLPLEQQKQAG